MDPAATSQPVQLLVSDVDGTLLGPDRELPDSCVAAAAELARAGVRLALASSRPPRGMAQFVVPLGLDGPLAGFNGAQVVTAQLESLRELSLPDDVVVELVSALRSAAVDVWAFVGSRWFVASPDGARVAHHAADVGYAPEVVEDVLDAALGAGAPVCKVVGVSEDRDAVAHAAALVDAALGGRVAATSSQPVYLDVTAPGATKGEALLALCELLDVPPAATVAIGDGANDVAMFDVAGWSVAMGNADDAVRAAAELVTAPNDGGGWAQAVRDVVLPAAAGSVR